MARVNVPVTATGFVAASLTTALSGTNNDLVFTARDGGPGGNDITVAYIVSGTNTALAVVANGKAIVVTVATDGGGAATSTAAEVRGKIEATSDANALVSIANAASNDGLGIVAALTATALAGGTLGVLRPSQTASDATNDHIFTGNDGLVLLEVENVNASPQTVQFQLAPGVAKGLSLTGAYQTETVTNGTVRVLGPFPTARFNQNAQGDVYFDPSVTTDLKFRALKAVRAQ
jgi:hypothetical protein